MTNVNHDRTGSAVLQSRELAAVSHKFAEDFARMSSRMQG